MRSGTLVKFSNFRAFLQKYGLIWFLNRVQLVRACRIMFERCESFSCFEMITGLHRHVRKFRALASLIEGRVQGGQFRKLF